MTSTKEKNPLPYIIAGACFLVLFILMKAQDVRTEARTNREPAKEAGLKREAASPRDSGIKKSKN